MAVESITIESKPRKVIANVTGGLHCSTCYTKDTLQWYVCEFNKNAYCLDCSKGIHKQGFTYAECSSARQNVRRDFEHQHIKINEIRSSS